MKREQWGDPTGDPEGNAEEGTEGDRYDALLTRAVQANYHLPPTISDRDRLHLAALLRIWVEPDGTITRTRVEKPSGNEQFDGAVERAARSTQAPPPPDTLRAEYHGRGRVLRFTP